MKIVFKQKNPQVLF